MRQQRIKRNEAKLAELGLLVALAPRTNTNRRKHVVMQDLAGSLDNLALAATSNKTTLQQLTAANLALTRTVSTLTIANKKLTEMVARFNLPPNIRGGYVGCGDAFPEPSGTITVGHLDTRPHKTARPALHRTGFQVTMCQQR